MDLKQAVKERVEKNLPKYYPREKLHVNGVERVSHGILSLFRPHALRSLIFKCRLSNGEAVYVKFFDKDTKLDVKEWMKLNKYSKELSIPKTFDYFKDWNAVVMEGVKGKKLFWTLLFGSMKDSVYYVRKVGESLGKLHKLTSGEKKRFNKKLISEVDPIIREVAGEKYGHVKRKIDDLCRKKVSIVFNYGDLTPFNILVDKNNIKIIDLSYRKTMFFEDLTHFSFYLESLKKFIFFTNMKYKKLNEVFLTSYYKYSPYVFEKNFLMLWKFIRYAYSIYFSKMAIRRGGLIKILINLINIRITNKKIKRIIKELN